MNCRRTGNARFCIQIIKELLQTSAAFFFNSLGQLRAKCERLFVCVSHSCWQAETKTLIASGSLAGISNSDVFSYALTLFEIATECKAPSPFPFMAAYMDEKEVAASFVTSEARGHPDFVRQLPAWLSDDVRRCLLRCLSIDVAQRPSAASLAELFTGLAPKDQEDVAAVASAVGQCVCPLPS